MNNSDNKTKHIMDNILHKIMTMFNLKYSQLTNDATFYFSNETVLMKTTLQGQFRF